MKNFLMFNIINVSKIFIIQTEYTRDLLNANSLTINKCKWIKEIANHNNIRDLEISMLTKFYSLLSELATKHKVQVHLIGGVTDVLTYSNFNLDFPNVSVACQSWTNLITAGNPNINWNDCVYSWYYGSKNANVISTFKHNKYSTSEILEHIEKGNNRRKLLNENPEYFWPDGTHPNQKGHKVLFDYLIHNKYL